MEPTSSASRAASPYSRAHGSAIAGREMDPIVGTGAGAGTGGGREMDTDLFRQCRRRRLLA
jgi:hypothetical protein